MKILCFGCKKKINSVPISFDMLDNYVLVPLCVDCSNGDGPKGDLNFLPIQDRRGKQ